MDLNKTFGRRSKQSDVRESSSQQDRHEPDQSQDLNKTDYIKRPMNEFMIWSTEERKRIQKENPTLHNSEISKLLGKIWKVVPEDRKDEYRAEARGLRESLMEEHPNYRYSPRRKPKNLQRMKMSGPPETEDRSENLTPGKRRYNRRSQLKNSPQQQQQQQVHGKLESIQHFVANLNAVPPLQISSNLPPHIATSSNLLGTSQYLAPSIPQIATGSTSNEMVASGSGTQGSASNDIFGNGSQGLIEAMNRNMNASSVAEALPSMNPNPNLVAQLLLLEMITNAQGGSGFGTMLNPYYSLGPSSMPQTGANVPSSSGAVNDPSLHPGTSGLQNPMSGNLNASSVAEDLPSMDPSVAQWFMMQMLMTGGFGTTLPMNLNPYYLPGWMPQTVANAPSSSGTSDGPSLHHKPSGLKKE